MPYFVYSFIQRWRPQCSLSASIPILVVKDAAVTTGVQISLGDPVLNSFLYVPRSRIAGSDANSI